MSGPTDPLREPPVRAVETVDAAVVLRLAGELDLYNAEEIRSAINGAIATSPRRIVVDLGEVDFIDSTALGMLIEARARIGNDRLALAAPKLETRRTLQVSGLDRHLAVYDTVEAALAG